MRANRCVASELPSPVTGREVLCSLGRALMSGARTEFPL